MDYQSWKASVLGAILDVNGVDGGQCTQVALSWGQALYPGVSWSILFPPVPNAKDFFSNVATHYFTAIANDHNDPNQLPQQGDIMVFDYTPQPGYTNAYNNPSGHIGVCDGASPQGYSLVQQNSPSFGAPVNVTTYPWRFRPCIGWLRPVSVAPVAEWHTVVPGDTVWGICGEFGISRDNDYAAFRALNPQVSDLSKIYVNEHVRVK